MPCRFADQQQTNDLMTARDFYTATFPTTVKPCQSIYQKKVPKPLAVLALQIGLCCSFEPRLEVRVCATWGTPTSQESCPLQPRHIACVMIIRVPPADFASVEGSHWQPRQAQGTAGLDTVCTSHKLCIGRGAAASPCSAPATTMLFLVSSAVQVCSCQGPIDSANCLGAHHRLDVSRWRGWAHGGWGRRGAWGNQSLFASRWR
jgi:hypothetical protein